MTKQTAVMHYKAAAATFAIWLRDGLISGEEYAQIDEIIASKYGLSSWSIHRDHRLQY